MKPRRDKPRDMRHIYHKICADFFGYFRNAFKIDDTRIRGSARNNQFRPAFFGFLFKFIIINIAVGIHAVGDKVEIFARHIDRRAVGQVTAFGKVHTHNGVAGLNQRKISRHIRLGAGVGLDVREVRAEQLFGAVNRDVLDQIDTFTAAVIALAGIAFGIFVGQHAAHGRHNGRGNDIFAGNQFQISALAGKFFVHRLADSRVIFCNKPDGVH